MRRTTIFALVGLVAILFALGWQFRFTTFPDSGQQGDSVVPSDTAPRDISAADEQSSVAVSAETKDYSSQSYRFALQYPDDLIVTEHDEGDGAASFVFENEDASRGFQIFVTPYAEATITKERFAQDQPSGALNEPVSATVDGAKGMMFYGSNGDIGDTVEVWFVRGGFLYEAYTYKSDEDLLMNVLGTWRFI